MSQNPGGTGFNPVPPSVSQRFGLQLGTSNASVHETASSGPGNTGFNPDPKSIGPGSYQSTGYGAQYSGYQSSGDGTQYSGVKSSDQSAGHGAQYSSASSSQSAGYGAHYSSAGIPYTSSGYGAQYPSVSSSDQSAGYGTQYSSASSSDQSQSAGYGAHYSSASISYTSSSYGSHYPGVSSSDQSAGYGSHYPGVSTSDQSAGYGAQYYSTASSSDPSAGYGVQYSSAVSSYNSSGNGTQYSGVSKSDQSAGYGAQYYSTASSSDLSAGYGVQYSSASISDQSAGYGAQYSSASSSGQSAGYVAQYSSAGSSDQSAGYGAQYSAVSSSDQSAGYGPQYSSADSSGQSAGHGTQYSGFDSQHGYNTQTHGYYNTEPKFYSLPPPPPPPTPPPAEINRTNVNAEQKPATEASRDNAEPGFLVPTKNAGFEHTRGPRPGMDSVGGPRPGMDSVRWPGPRIDSVRGPRPGIDHVRGPGPGFGSVRGPGTGTGMGSVSWQRPRMDSLRGPRPGIDHQRGPGPGFESVRGPGPGNDSVRGHRPGFDNVRGPAPGIDSLRGPRPGIDSVRGPRPGFDNVRGPAPGIDSLRGPRPGIDHVRGPRPGLESVREHAPGIDSSRGPQPGNDSVRGPRPLIDQERGPGPGIDSVRGPPPGFDDVRRSASGPDSVRGPPPGFDSVRGPRPVIDHVRWPGPGLDSVRGPGPKTDGVRGPAPGIDNSRGPAPGIDSVRDPASGSDHLRGPEPGIGNSRGSGPGIDSFRGPRPGIDGFRGPRPGFDSFRGPRPGIDGFRGHRQGIDGVRGPRPGIDSVRELGSDMDSVRRPGSGTDSIRVPRPGIDSVRGPGPEFDSFRGPRPGFDSVRGPRIDNASGPRPGVHNMPGPRPGVDNMRVPRPLMDNMARPRPLMDFMTRGPRPPLESSKEPEFNTESENVPSKSQAFNPDPSFLGFGQEKTKPSVGDSETVKNTGRQEFGMDNSTEPDLGNEEKDGPRPLLSQSFNPHPSVLGVTSLKKSEQVGTGKPAVKNIELKQGKDNTSDAVKTKELGGPAEPVPLMSLSLTPNTSFVEKDQDFGQAENAEQADNQEASDSDADWEDEEFPSLANFNPLPVMLVPEGTDMGTAKTSILKQKELFNPLLNFVRSGGMREPSKEGIEPSGDDDEENYETPEKRRQMSVLKVEFFPPIPRDNIGNVLLQKLGWRPGTGLGPSRTGIKQPVSAFAYGRSEGRHGLGGKLVKRKSKEKEKDTPFETPKSQKEKDALIAFVKVLVQHFYNGTKSPCCVLNEYCNKRKRKIAYRVTHVDTEVPNSKFGRKCLIAGKFYETAVSSTKRMAKFAAATNAFKMLVREMYQEFGLPFPADVESQLSEGRESQTYQLPKKKRWQFLPEEKETAPRPVKQTIRLTKDLEDIVKRFYEGFKPAANAILEYCQKHKLKVEYKEIPATKYKEYGCRCYIGEVEYELGTGISKKTAKADASMKAFVAFVKNVYENSGTLLPLPFIGHCNEVLAWLKKQEEKAAEESKQVEPVKKPRLEWDQLYNPREGGEATQPYQRGMLKNASAPLLNYGEEEEEYEAEEFSWNYDETPFNQSFPRHRSETNVLCLGLNKQPFNQGHQNNQPYNQEQQNRQPYNQGQQRPSFSPRQSEPIRFVRSTSESNIDNSLYKKSEFKHPGSPSLNFRQNVHSQNLRTQRPALNSSQGQQPLASRLRELAASEATFDSSQNLKQENQRFQKPPSLMELNSKTNWEPSASRLNMIADEAEGQHSIDTDDTIYDSSQNLQQANSRFQKPPSLMASNNKRSWEPSQKPPSLMASNNKRSWELSQKPPSLMASNNKRSWEPSQKPPSLMASNNRSFEPLASRLKRIADEATEPDIQDEPSTDEHAIDPGDTTGIIGPWTPVEPEQRTSTQETSKPSAQASVPTQSMDSKEMMTPPSYTLIQQFRLGAKHAKTVLHEYCFKNKANLRYKAGNFSKMSSVRSYERQCEVNGKLYDFGKGTSKKTAEEDAARVAFTAILKEFNLDDQG